MLGAYLPDLGWEGKHKGFSPAFCNDIRVCFDVLVQLHGPPNPSPSNLTLQTCGTKNVLEKNKNIRNITASKG